VICSRTQDSEDTNSFEKLNASPENINRDLKNHYRFDAKEDLPE
jgi:hypothetical protein